MTITSSEMQELIGLVGNESRENAERAVLIARGMKREIRRLRGLLRKYDVCECGHMRASHEGHAVAHACREFRLAIPADPLETIIDGKSVGELADAERSSLLDARGILPPEKRADFLRAHRETRENWSSREDEGEGE